MIKNVGSLDRGIRIAAGVALIGASLFGMIGAWGYLGLVPLLTGLSGRCPPYAMLGINTCSMKKPG